MSLVIHCPNCTQRFQIAEQVSGKRVRCQRCGHVFAAATTTTLPPPLPLVVQNPHQPLAAADFLQFSALSPTAPQHDSLNPYGPNVDSAQRFAPTYAHSKKASVSNPSGGPTDARMRLVSCGMLAMGFILTVGSLALEAATGSIYLAIVGLVPLMLVVGITGLVSPNSIRSIGKYGGHLPGYYKVAGWGVIGLSFLLTIAVLVGLFIAGYQTDVPRPPPYPRPDYSSPVAEAVPSAGFGGQEAPPAKKPPKSYPVSIVVPEHSRFVPSDARLPAGTRLEACWAGKWNPITLLSENEDGSLNVRWDDFGSAFDCSMIRGELIIRKDVLKASQLSP